MSSPFALSSETKLTVARRSSSGTTRSLRRPRTVVEIGGHEQLVSASGVYRRTIGGRVAGERAGEF
jgi:hypothetical protein